MFNPQKEKETYIQEQKEFTAMDQGASTWTVPRINTQVCETQHVYDMPLVFYPSLQLNGKEGTLKDFL